MSLAEQIIYESEARAVQAIKLGADVDEFDRFGFRPLIQAVICRKPQVLEALIASGADLEQVDFLGRSPLQWATDRGEVALCQRLLAAGANPNHHSFDGEPILVKPILREELEMVELFLKHGVNYAFAQDFISAKLLGHRFELTGEADIVNAQDKFIPLSFEGFNLEFSTALLSRSLNNFSNSIPGQQFEALQAPLSRVQRALRQAAQLASFARYKDKSPFESAINSLLDSELLLLPAGYEGHAISFIKYGKYWAKCDRGVGTLADTVIIYEIGNPYGLNNDFYRHLLYQPKTEAYIHDTIKDTLALRPLKSLPSRHQLTGNCSWANIETSVAAMLFMLELVHSDPSRQQLQQTEKKVYRFYHQWVDWDQDTALDEAITDFYEVNPARQLSKAVIFGSILVQRCLDTQKKFVRRGKKILSILTQPNYRFILENYRRVYFRPTAGRVGKKFKQLLKACAVNAQTLVMKHPIKHRSETKQAPSQQVKMTTALHVAALTNQLTAVEYLVERLQLEVNYLDRTGSTALMYAAWKGHTAVVEYLLQAGATAGIKNHKGGTAARYAAYANHRHIVTLLQQHA